MIFVTPEAVEELVTVNWGLIGGVSPPSTPTSGDPSYDMTGIPARFEAISFAAPPQVTNYVTVNNQSELNSALAVSGNHITLNPAGTYTGISFSASDIDIVASGASISGGISLNNGPIRLRITGGTFAGGVSGFGTNSDVTFDQVTTNQGWTVQAISGRSLERMTVLNTTVNAPDPQYGLFAFNLRDVIYANCNVTNTDASVAGMRLIACQGFIAIDSRISTNGNRIVRVHGDGATLPAYDHLIYNCQLESTGSNNLWLGPAAGGAAGRIERFEMHNSRIYYPSAGIGGGWFQMDSDVSPGIGDVIVQNNTGYTPDSAVRTGPVPDSPYTDTPNTFNSYQTPPAFTGGATNS